MRRERERINDYTKTDKEMRNRINKRDEEVTSI
jgi:hypothetical protein